MSTRASNDSVPLKRHGRKDYPGARRGYLIIEMLFWIGLLTIFGLAAGHLFRSTFRVIHETSQQTEAATRFDAAVKVLRADIASSTASESNEPRAMTLRTTSGDVHWSIDENHVLSRAAAGVVEQRWSVDQPIEFHQDGSVVLLRIAGDAAGELAFAPAATVRRQP
jgi:hypothetical protein